MTKDALELRGRSTHLVDGTEVQVWVEEGADGIAVAILHADAVVGRVTATRLFGRSAAELTAWTSVPWRRRGLATMGVDEVLAWARRRDVPYLHGDLPAGEADAAAVAFLHSCGLLTAVRTDSKGRSFAALEPAAA